MAAKLVAEEGNQKGVVLSLENGEEWVVGRDPEQCSFALEDPSASRKHMVLRTTAEGILIENLSETNPTQVNGKNLETPLLLNQGDTVKVGNSVFRYYATPEAHITEKEEEIHNTLFDVEEKAPVKNELAKINFDFMGGGRWLLKVISGPNNGAEYNMQDGSSYTIGTDPTSCDIVFHDNSVSRQHARLAIDAEGVTIQDLKSRNGTIVDGKKIETPAKLQTNTVVSIGTTSFLIFDREGEMQTIISPILPSKALKEEEAPPPVKKEEEPIKGPSPEVIEAAKAALQSQVIKPAKEKGKGVFGKFLLIGIITGLFVIAGIGTMMLFKSEPVKEHEEVNADKIIDEAVAPFAPGVKRGTFNKSTGSLLLVGHVLTPNDKTQLMYNLQSLPFIRNIDDSGVIIDELVWRNLNQILTRNPDWKSITLTAPKPGHFVLTGYLKNRKQAEELYDYINTHFDYLDLLDKKVIVEEDVANAITTQMRNHGFTGVNASMENGVITLTGIIPPDKAQLFNTTTAEIRKIPEVRALKSNVTFQVPEQAFINVSDKYKVSGVSQMGTNLSVVINGRILAKGDTLDGMTLTDITRSHILLEKDNVKYRIDY